MNIVIIDIESTGVNICTDRVCSIAAIRYNESFEAISPLRHMLINPGIPIPKEASDIHGITDEMVKDAPSFGQVAKGFVDFTEGAAIGGFNSIRFDVPIIAEELWRHKSIRWPAPGTKFIDAYKIFIEKEPRDLAGAARFYLQKSHDEAHDAAADVKATAEVLFAQMTRYPDLMEGGIDAAAGMSQDANAADIGGYLAFNEAGHLVFAFGKEKGQLCFQRTHYINWMLSNAFPIDTKRILNAVVNGIHVTRDNIINFH